MIFIILTFVGVGYVFYNGGKVNAGYAVILTAGRDAGISIQWGVLIVNFSKMKNVHISAIRFSTLAAICDVLLCQPGDILEYSPEEKDD